MCNVTGYLAHTYTDAHTYAYIYTVCVLSLQYNILQLIISYSYHLLLGYSQEKLVKLKADLEQAGYSSFETSIGTSGVTQHLITTDVSHDP